MLKISEIIRNAASRDAGNAWAKDPVGPPWGKLTRNTVRDLFQYAKKKNQQEAVRSLGSLVNYCAHMARDMGYRDLWAPLTKLGNDLLRKAQELA